MKKAPEQYRVRQGPVGSDASYENNGFFIIPHYRVYKYELRCQVSDGQGWEHVSVTVGRKGVQASRNPTWDEMCFVKGVFWSEDECVIEYHPPKSVYVSCHPFCLHLWKIVGHSFPVPDAIFVDLRNL